MASIAKFEAAFSGVDGLLADLPAEALAFVPEVADAWSIQEHLVHLLDAETAVYFRLRKSIAEPGATVQFWEEESWHEKLAYRTADARRCLEAAKALRSVLSATLRAIVDEDWSAFWLDHPEKGRLELERLVEMYREHLAFHLPYIKRNRDAWRQRG
jgi:hypothetical protein